MDNRHHRPTERVLDILEFIAQKNDGETLSRISSALDIPKGTIFPLLQTLVSRGYLETNSHEVYYRLGLKAFALGMQYLHQGYSAEDDVLSVMKNVVGQCNETCHYGKLSGGNVIYIFKIESKEPIRMFSAPGKSSFAYATALGKALLSGKTRQEILALYPNGFTKITDNTITDIDELMQQLQETRVTSIASECEENENMIRCFATPIILEDDVIAAISITIPTFRCTDEKIKQVIDLLPKAKSQIESILRVMR